MEGFLLNVATKWERHQNLNNMEFLQWEVLLLQLLLQLQTERQMPSSSTLSVKNFPKCIHEQRIITHRNYAKRHLKWKKHRQSSETWITNQYRSIKTSAGKCEQDLVCDNHNTSRGISSLYLSDELSATGQLLVNRTNQADGMYKRWQRPFYYT